jgi:uncharacterized lipoprotein YbaY
MHGSRSKILDCLFAVGTAILADKPVQVPYVVKVGDVLYSCRIALRHATYTARPLGVVVYRCRIALGHATYTARPLGVVLYRCRIALGHATYTARPLGVVLYRCRIALGHATYTTRPYVQNKNVLPRNGIGILFFKAKK